MISVSTSPPMIAAVPVERPSPNTPHMPTATKDPIMNTSPWAKLISSMIP